MEFKMRSMGVNILQKIKTVFSQINQLGFGGYCETLVIIEKNFKGTWRKSNERLNVFLQEKF